MASSKRDKDQDLLMALCHPVRRRILRAMPEDGDASVSPCDLSVALDESLTHLSYHTRVLAKFGAAKLVRTEPLKGPFERHLYSRTVKPKWARMLLAEVE